MYLIWLVPNVFKHKLRQPYHVVTCKNFLYKFMKLKRNSQELPEPTLGTTNIIMFSFDINSSFYLKINQSFYE